MLHVLRTMQTCVHQKFNPSFGSYASSGFCKVCIHLLQAY